MPLIKLDNSISDISGKLGGVYFSRDNSGLHTRAMPRVIKQQPTEIKEKAKYFYGAVKQEEHIRNKLGWEPLEDAQAPENEQQDPQNKKTAQIFQLKNLSGIRKLSLTNPTTTGPDEADIWYNRLVVLEYSTYLPWLEKLGIDHVRWLNIIRKYYMISRYTWGVIAEESYADTIVYIINLLEKLELCASIPGITELLILSPTLIVFLVTYLLAKHEGHTEFAKGRVIIKKHDGLFWGQIVGHTTKKMLDFYLISPAFVWPYHWELNYTDHPYRTDYLYLDSIHQTVFQSLLGYPVFTWEKIETVYRGMAFQAAPYIYRLEASPDELYYWNLPVGWVNTDPDLLNYPNYIEQYFSYSAFHYPPL